MDNFSLEKKSLLGKLLAKENVKITFGNYKTASFSVSDRDLRIPIPKSNTPEEAVNLFIVHEVGHALFTPKHDTNPYINIVEDIRIDKLIQDTYPGSKKDFRDGYKFFVEEDFFKIKDRNIDKMNFADRINLHFKIQTDLFFKNDTERELFNRINGCKTFEDVLRVSEELKSYVKEEIRDEKKENNSQNPDENDEANENQINKNNEIDQDTIGENNEANENQIEEEDNESLVDENNENKDEKNENNESLTDSQDSLDEGDEDIITDNIFSQIADEIDEDDLFEFDKALKDDCRNLIGDKNIDDKRVKKLIRNTNDIVSYMAREFDRKKKAATYKKISEHKTGKLDTNKLYKYKISENIFKKNEMVKEGQSHGLIVFLDCSSSMRERIKDSIKQLYILILFCKKVKIPFHVYMFTSFEDHILYKILSSKMSKNDFDNNFKTIYEFKNFHMGITPLNRTIMHLDEIVNSFKEENNVDNINVVFITDGADSDRKFTYISRQGEIIYNDGNISGTHVLINHFKDKNKNVKIVNFFIDNFSSHYKAEYMIGKFADKNLITKQMENDFKNNIPFEVDGKAFDKVYFVDDSFLKLKKEDKITHTNMIKDNKKSKIFLSKFCELIS